MKRRSKIIFAMLLSCVLAFSGYGVLLHTQAAQIGVKEVVCPATEDENYKFKPEKTAAYNQYGTPYLLYRNGTRGFTLHPHISLYCDTNNTILYCVEPGTDYSTNSVDTGDFWNTWRAWNHNHGVDDLEVADAKRLLGLIVKYGYQNKLYSDSAPDTIMHAYATQILVWETVTGERDSSFNYIAPNYSSNCQLDRIRDNMPHRDLFFQHYRRIENQVQTLNGNIRPSFAGGSADKVPLHTMRYEDGKFVITLENASGNIGSGVGFSAVADGEPFTEITFSRAGNKLIIESTDEYEGVVHVTASCKETYAEPITISDGVYAQGQGQQDMIHVPVLTPDNAVQITDVGWFDLKFPHVHRYIPFFTDPTCIHRGYTTWVCKCTDSYVNNYTDPLGHNFCPVSKTMPGCTEAGETQYRCTRCGAAYMEKAEPTGHSEPVWVTTIPATCTKAGEQVAYCTTCGTALDSRPIAALGHGATVMRMDFDATEDHDGQMTPYCSVCGQAVGESETFELHTHEAGAAKVLLQATCTTAGEMGEFCSICGACFATEPIEALGHENTVAITKLPATCTINGEKQIICTDCGKIVDTEEIPASGHTAGAWNVTTSATCTTVGREVCSCALCGENIDSREIPALGHDEGTWKTKTPATCTTDGEQLLVCTRCNAVTQTSVIPALGHDEGVWTITKKPTCTAAGEQVCTCTRCGRRIDSQKLAAAGHDDGYWRVDFEATPDHDGQMSRYCSVCREVLESKPFTMHTHAEGYRKQLLEPTCTTDGEGGVFCTVCGAVYETYPIAALGHDYGAWSTNNNGTHKRTCSRCHDLQIENCKYSVVVLEPTCTEGGYTTYHCDVCDYTYTGDYTDPLGHIFGEWTDTGDGSTHRRTCVRCGTEEYEGHLWGPWQYDHNAGLFRAGTKTRHCLVCDAIQVEKAHHTSWICRVFYPIGLFICNFLNKLGYTVSLDWLFPWLNIQPSM